MRLHSFTTTNGGGSIPYGPVVETVPGTLHGMTSFGGTNGVGLIYTMQTDGTGYRSLRSFIGDAADGGLPYGALVQGADGAMYGTTWYGGPSDQGTIFKLGPDGSNYQVICSISRAAGATRWNPYAGLAQGTDGALYGTSWSGIANREPFTARNRPRGRSRRCTILREAHGRAESAGGVIEGSDGLSDGTAVQGGTANCGVIYKRKRGRDRLCDRSELCEHEQRRAIFLTRIDLGQGWVALRGDVVVAVRVVGEGFGSIGAGAVTKC